MFITAASVMIDATTSIAVWAIRNLRVAVVATATKKTTATREGFAGTVNSEKKMYPAFATLLKRIGIVSVVHTAAKT